MKVDRKFIEKAIKVHRNKGIAVEISSIVKDNIKSDYGLLVSRGNDKLVPIVINNGEKRDCHYNEMCDFKVLNNADLLAVIARQEQRIKSLKEQIDSARSRLG